MGQPAARATIDVSAHSGPIQSGSPDVIIGGFPPLERVIRYPARRTAAVLLWGLRYCLR